MRLLTASLGGLGLCLAACGEGEGDDGASYNCATEERADDFVVGLSKVGEQQRMTFTLVSFDPAPPQRDNNHWTLKLETMPSPGTPVTDATMTVRPFMPDHKHGAKDPAKIMPGGEPGIYELDPINMWMPGLWEVTIQVTGADSDRAVFRFCLAS